MKARIKGLEKMLQEQNEYIQDVKEVEKGKTKEKAEALMKKFKSISKSSDEEDAYKQLKTKYSLLTDENIQMKEMIADLRNRITKETNTSHMGMSETPEEEKELQEMGNTVVALRQELKEYESMLENKDKELKEAQNQLYKVDEEKDAIFDELQQSRRKAHDLILKKDKEIEKLRRIKKKIEDQYNSLKSAFEKVPSSSKPDLSLEKSTDDINDTIVSEMGTEPLDEGLSDEDKSKPKIPQSAGIVSSGVQLYKDDKILIERKISYNIEEQYKERIGKLKNKINDLEDLIKYHMAREQDMVDKVNDLQRSKTREGVSVEYIKNVYVSYLEYKAMKNDKEAKTCELVLFTALRLSPQEIKEIDRLRKKYKNYKFWKLIPQSSTSKKKKEKEMQMLLSNTAKLQEMEKNKLGN